MQEMNYNETNGHSHQSQSAHVYSQRLLCNISCGFRWCRAAVANKRLPKQGKNKTFERPFVTEITKAKCMIDNLLNNIKEIYTNEPEI